MLSHKKRGVYNMRLGFIPLFNEFYTTNKIFAANGMAYIASYLEQELGYRDIFIEVEEDQLFEQNPDIIGITCTTQDFNRARAIAQRAKDKNIPVIMGGIHISSMPHLLPPEMDIGVIGEGEKTMVEIMQLYFKNQVNPENLREVNGICFHDEKGKVAITPPREMENDLDVFPIPRRDLFQNKEGHWAQAISTSRGCYYDCVFCSAATYWETVRYHSPERVVLDIEDIIKRFPHQQTISIDDLLFAIHKKRLTKIVSLIREARLHKKVSFVCTARASAFRKDIAALLKDMNVHSICFGYESPIDKVVRYLKGPSADMKTNIRSMDLCQRYGMVPVGNYIVGTPVETIQDMAQTYWIVRNNKYRHTPNIFYMNPLPGTALWNQCVRDGYVSDNIEDWNVLDMKYERGRSIFLNEHYSLDEFDHIYSLMKSLEPATSPKISLQEQLRSEYYQERLKEIGHFIYDHKIFNNILEISDNKERLKDIADEILPDVTIERLMPSDIRQDDFDEEVEHADLIVFVHALEQFHQPEKALESIVSKMKPGTLMYFTWFNALHISHIIEMFLGRWEAVRFGIHQDYHLKFYTEETIKKLFQKTGCQIIQQRPHHMNIDRFKSFIQTIKPMLEPHISLEKMASQFDIVSYSILVQTPISHTPDKSHKESESIVV